MPSYQVNFWQERLGLGPDHKLERTIEAADDQGAIKQALQIADSLDAQCSTSAGLTSVSRLVNGSEVRIWPSS